ncbi:helix-turn-helix domain-containing protein [Hyunsoonleella sp. 2307UL5-6]|uniref:helix-turn-helix domain-containing protein n=1 Tax=Hyunsoonleella sp. 2307UL5-6 TaxID=3384768 RepID=UPI0039BC3974
MTIIEIANNKTVSIIEQLKERLDGTVRNIYGEEILEFNNKIGCGTIRNVAFDWGITLLDYDVCFNEDLKIVYKLTESSPVEFLFISKGMMQYSADNTDYVELDRFQNVIISNKLNSKNVFVFPSTVDVQLNVIQVTSSEYEKKKNNNINSLPEKLLSVFKGSNENLPYKHFGGHNLKIASVIKNLNNTQGSGIIKSLSIEGQLNLILALQIAEHKNFINKNVLPDSLSQNDMKKVHDVANYIVNNVSKYMSIKSLSSLFGLTPKKLQSGFKLLYSKSVNEYIRQIKLEIARDLIKNTDNSISEIVYSIGYRSRSYFSKIFYDKYSILPTDYRDSIKKGLKAKAE